MTAINYLQIDVCGGEQGQAEAVSEAHLEMVKV